MIKYLVEFEFTRIINERRKLKKKKERRKK